MASSDPDEYDLSDFVQVESSHLLAVRYYRNYEVLLVQFTDGSVWRYDGVEWSIYMGLLRAYSHGEYFADMIRLEYPFYEL